MENRDQNGDEIIEDSEIQREQEASDIVETEHSNTESEIQEMREEQQMEAEIRDLENQRKNGSKNFIEQGQIRNFEDKLKKQLQELKDKHNTESLIRSGKQAVSTAGRAGVKVVQSGAKVAGQAIDRYRREQARRRAPAPRRVIRRPVQPQPQPYQQQPQQEVQVHQPQQVQPRLYSPMPFSNPVFVSGQQPFSQSSGLGQQQVFIQPQQTQGRRRVPVRPVQQPFGGWQQQRPAGRVQRVRAAPVPFTSKVRKGGKPKRWF